MGKGKYLINTLKESEKHDGVTLVCCFSRKIFVPYFFEALKELELPKDSVHLLVYDNTEDPLLQAELASQVEKIAPKFRSVRLYKSYLKGRGNITGSGNEMFKISKLYNIWQMWKKIYVSKGGMIYTSLMFQLEDDTIAPPWAYKRLFQVLEKHPEAAMVTGISTGRNPLPWVPVRLGVHYLKAKGFKILERHYLNPAFKGIVEVDCSGVYCFAARTALFKKGFRNYDPDKYKTPFFGMDNVLTWNIKKQGYSILADFSVWVSHLDCSGTRILAFSKDQAIEQVDLWIPKFSNYAQGIEVKKRAQRARRYQVRKFALSWEI